MPSTNSRLAEPGGWDPVSRTFDTTELQVWLSRRCLNYRDMIAGTGLGSTTINKVRRGVRCREETANRIRRWMADQTAKPLKIAV